MKDIFTELYKKVIGVFQKQEEKENNKDVACNRLKLVLMQDRTNLTPYLLERMRGEMIDVLSKYVEMDKEALELNFEAEGESMALMLSIPVVRAKEEDEIQAILKAEEEAKAKLAEDETSEEEAEDESEEEAEDESKEVEAQEAEIDKTEKCDCDPCECQDCDCAQEVEESTDEVEKSEKQDEAESCDWENPECDDAAAEPKKKKKKN